MTPQANNHEEAWAIALMRLLTDSHEHAIDDEELQKKVAQLVDAGANPWHIGNANSAGPERSRARIALWQEAAGGRAHHSEAFLDFLRGEANGEQAEISKASKRARAEAGEAELERSSFEHLAWRAKKASKYFFTWAIDAGKSSDVAAKRAWISCAEVGLAHARARDRARSKPWEVARARADGGMGAPKTADGINAEPAILAEIPAPPG